MCSVRCRKSTRKQCKCECGGLYHGAEVLSPEKRRENLLRKFPPCTPIRTTSTSSGKVYRGRVRDIQIFDTVVVSFLFDDAPFYASTIQLDEEERIGSEFPF